MATPRRAVASWACRCLTSEATLSSVTPCTAYHAAKLLSRANHELLNSAPPAGDGRGRNPARGGRLQAPPRGRSPRRRHHRRRPSEGLQRQARHQSRAREPPPKAASHRWERALGARPCELAGAVPATASFVAALTGQQASLASRSRGVPALHAPRRWLLPSPAAGELCEPRGAPGSAPELRAAASSGASSRRRPGGS